MKKKLLAAFLILCAITQPAYAMKVKVKIYAKDITVTMPETTYRGIVIPETELEAEVLEQTVSITVPDPVISIPPIEAPAPTPVPTPPAPPVVSGKPPIFSSSTFWRAKLADNAALSSRSAALMSRLMWWTNNADPWINEMDGSGDKRNARYVVTNADPKVPVYDIEHAWQSNAKELALGINWPQNIVIAGGTDKNVSIYNKDTDTLYEFWIIQFQNNRWETRAAGILHNASKSDGTFPFVNGEWNSSRASHLPLWPGLITKDGLEAGNMGHEMSLAMPKCAKNIPFVYPAKSTDGESAANTDYDANAMPMGTRLRFPANIVINPNWTPLTKALVTTIRDYGCVVTDTTAGWSIGFGTDRDPSVGNSSILAPFQKRPSDGVKRELWDIMGQKNKPGEFPWDKLVVLA